MVGVGLERRENHKLAVGVGNIRIGRNLKTGEPGVSGWVGIMDEEPPVGSVVWIKRQAQHTLLAAVRHLAADVEEWSYQKSAVLDDANAAGLLDNEQPGGVVGRSSEIQREAQAGGNFEQTRSGPLG